MGNHSVSKTMRGFLSDLYESGSIHPNNNDINNNTSSANSTPRRTSRRAAPNTTAPTSHHHPQVKPRHPTVDDMVLRGTQQHTSHTDLGGGSVVFVTGGSRSGSTLSAISGGMEDSDGEEYQYRYGDRNHTLITADEDTPLAHMAASPFSSAAYSHFKRNGPSVKHPQQPATSSSTRGHSLALKTSVRSPLRQRNEKPLHPDTARSRAFNHGILSVAQEERTVVAHRKLQHADELVSGVLNKHQGGSRVGSTSGGSPSVGAGGGGTSKGAIILHLRSRVEELETLLDNSERANFELGDGCDQLKTELVATRRRHQETLEDIHYHHSSVTKQLQSDKEDCIQRCDERVTDLCSEWTAMLNKQAQHEIMSTETQVRAALESSFSLLFSSTISSTSDTITSSTTSAAPISLLHRYDTMMRQFSASMDDRISTSNKQKKELSLQVDAALQLVEDAKMARDVKSQDNRRLTDEMESLKVELELRHAENESLQQQMSDVQLSRAISDEEWSELLGRHEVESEQLICWKAVEMDATVHNGGDCMGGGVTFRLPVHTTPEYADQQAFLSAADFIVSRTASRLSSITARGEEGGGGNTRASRTASNALLGVSCSTTAGRTSSYHNHAVVVPSLQFQLLEMEARSAIILSACAGVWDAVLFSPYNLQSYALSRDPSVKAVRSRATTPTSTSNNNSGGQFGGYDGEEDAFPNQHDSHGSDAYYRSTWQNHARPDPEEVLRRLSVGGISSSVSRTPSNRQNINAPIPRPFAPSSSRRPSGMHDALLPSSLEHQPPSSNKNEGYADATDAKVASLEEELEVVNTTLKRTQDESQQQLTKLSELQAELTSTKEVSSELQRRLYMCGEMKKSQQEVMLRNVTEEAVSLRREREGWRALVAQLQLDAVEMEDTLRIVESSLFNEDGRKSSPKKKRHAHMPLSASDTLSASGRRHRRKPPVPRQKGTPTTLAATKPPWVDIGGDIIPQESPSSQGGDASTTTPAAASKKRTDATAKPQTKHVTLPVDDNSPSTPSCTSSDNDDDDKENEIDSNTIRHKGAFSYSRDHVEWLLLQQQRRLMHSVLTPAIASDTKAHLAAVVDLSLLRATSKDGVGIPISSATNARGGTRVGGESTSVDFDLEITKPPVQTPGFTNNDKADQDVASINNSTTSSTAESLRRFKSRLHGISDAPSTIATNNNNTDRSSNNLFASLADEIGKSFNLLDAGILFVKHRRFISEVLITAERLEGLVRELSQVRLMLLSPSSGGGPGAHHHHSSIPTYLKVFLENMSRQLLMLYRDGLMGIVSRDGVDVTGPIRDVSDVVRKVPVLSAWADTEAQDRNSQLTLLRQMDEAALTRGGAASSQNNPTHQRHRHRSPLRQLKGVPLGGAGNVDCSYAGGGWIAHNATCENLPPPYTFRNGQPNDGHPSTASQVQYWPSKSSILYSSSPPNVYSHRRFNGNSTVSGVGQSGMNNSASFMAEVQHAAHSKHRQGITKNLQFSQQEFDDGHLHGDENASQNQSSWKTPPRGNRHGQPTSPPSGGMRHEGGGGYTPSQLQLLRQRTSPTQSANTSTTAPTSYTRSCTADPVYCFESGHNCREPYYTTLASSAGRGRNDDGGVGSRPSIDVSSPQSPMRSYSSPPAARRKTTARSTPVTSRIRGSSSTAHNRNKYRAAQESTFDTYYHVNDRSPVPMEDTYTPSTASSPTSVLWGKGRGMPTRNNNTTTYYPSHASNSGGDAAVVPSLPHGGSWISHRDGGKQQQRVDRTHTGNTPTTSASAPTTPVTGVSIASPERANLLSSSRPFGSSKHGALWESASKAPPALSRMSNLPPTTASASD